MSYSDEILVGRWEDQRDLKNLMGQYANCVILNGEAQLFDRFWSKSDQVALGFNHGWYRGAQAIRGYYNAVAHRGVLVAELLQKRFPDRVPPHTQGIGPFQVKPMSCPVIEVAPDGETAHGLWYCQGAYAQVYTYGPSASWTWGYYDVHFCREEGGWKICSLLCVNDVDARCGTSWGKPEEPLPDLPEFAALGEYTLPLPSHPAMLRDYYSPTRPLTGAPALPQSVPLGKAQDKTLQRVLDVEAIKTLVHKRVYAIAGDCREEELQQLWVSQPDHQATASFGRNWGFYVGMDAIRKYYVNSHDAQLLAQSRQTGGVKNQGNLYAHPASTGLVELAEDGETAQGMWYCIAQETMAQPDGTATARWMLEKLAFDFVKEDGQWKIWHLVIATDLTCQAGEVYSDQPVYVNWESDPIKSEFGTPTVEALLHDATFNWWDNYPPMPSPYATYDPEKGYGPAGWRAPTVKSFAAGEGGNYR